MPLVIIHSLAPADSDAIPRMLAEVRDDGARALACSPNNIWVMFDGKPPGFYVQGMNAASIPQADSHPPCVIIRAQSGRTPPERSALAKAVAAAVARGLSVPADNVWIHYEEMRPQDVWFGGHWSG